MATMKVKIRARPFKDGWLWRYEVHVSNGLWCAGGAWNWQTAWTAVEKFASDTGLV